MAHNQFEEIKKLNIQSDPWDNYLYYDSKFLFDFIFNNKSTNVEEKFIELKFLLFIYYNDFIANFRSDGKTIAWKLNDYIKKITHDDVEKSEGREGGYLHDFVRKMVYSKYEPNENEIETFETKLETVFDLFIQDLTSLKKFSETKEDYFKI